MMAILHGCGDIRKGSVKLDSGPLREGASGGMDREAGSVVCVGEASDMQDHVHGFRRLTVDDCEQIAPDSRCSQIPSECGRLRRDRAGLAVFADSLQMLYSVLPFPVGSPGGRSVHELGPHVATACDSSRRNAR